MPESFSAALATPGLIWVMLAALVGSTVRGFSGFGTAMVYLPVASQVLGPVPALLSLTVMDSFGSLPAVPRAIREADWPDLRRLLLGVLIMMPVGVYVLVSVSPDMFRTAVSGVTLVLLAILISGVRYTGRIGPRKVVGIGGAAGFLGGSVGLPGPVVILFYMASSHAPHVIRATTFVFLLAFDISLVVWLFIQGLITQEILLISVVLVPTVAIGTLLGTALFDPSREKLYRWVAYTIIAVSALRGLPIWG